MCRSRSRLVDLSLGVISLPFLAACGNPGITLVESSKAASSTAQKIGGSSVQSSNGLSVERKAIAERLVEEVQNFNVLMLGRRQITDGKINGPVAERDGLTGSERNVYCVTLQVKADRAEYLAGELRFIARVRRSENFVSTKLERTQLPCAAGQVPFPELVRLSAGSPT